MSLSIGEPIDPRVPFVRTLHDLDAAWQVGASGPRQRAVESAGKRVGDALREGPEVVSVRTLPTSASAAVHASAPVVAPTVVPLGAVVAR